MPSIGAAEIVIILVLALLVFGPKRLPEMGRSLGRSVREFKKASDTARKEFGVDEIEREIKGVKKSLDDVRGDLKIDIDAEASKPSAAPAVTAAVAAAQPPETTDGDSATAAATQPPENAGGDAAAGDAASPDSAPPSDDDGEDGEDEVLVGDVVDDEPEAAPAADALAGQSGPSVADAETRGT